MAHARIVSVDSTYAQAMPGVLAVYTNDDLGLPKFPTIMGMTNEAMTLRCSRQERCDTWRTDRRHRR